MWAEHNKLCDSGNRIAWPKQTDLCTLLAPTSDDLSGGLRTRRFRSLTNRLLSASTLFDADVGSPKHALITTLQPPAALDLGRSAGTRGGAGHQQPRGRHRPRVPQSREGIQA